MKSAETMAPDTIGTQFPNKRDVPGSEAIPADVRLGVGDLRCHVCGRAFRGDGTHPDLAEAVPVPPVWQEEF